MQKNSICFCLFLVIGYDPKSSSPDHFPVVSLKEMRQLKEVNFRWADDQQFGAPKNKSQFETFEA